MTSTTQGNQKWSFGLHHQRQPPHLHRSLKLSPIEEGEYVIIKDTKEAKPWYCAQVLEKLPDRIKVSYYTTTTPALVNHAKAPYSERLLRIQEAIFLKTWALLTHWRGYHFGSSHLTEEDPALDWISPPQVPG
jgi:hypothetical protein